MRYKVPQKIDLEDRVLGPMTMRQVAYLFASGTISYAIYTSLLKLESFSSTASLIISSPPLLVGFAFAFLKIQDRTFSEFLGNLFLYLSKPKQYIWTRSREISLQKPAPITPTKQISQKKPLQKTELEKLALILDTRGNLNHRNLQD